MENDRRRSSRRGNRCRLCICLRSGDYTRRYSTDPERESKQKLRHAIRTMRLRNYIMHYL